MAPHLLYFLSLLNIGLVGLVLSFLVYSIRLRATQWRWEELWKSSFMLWAITVLFSVIVGVSTLMLYLLLSGKVSFPSN